MKYNNVFTMGDINKNQVKEIKTTESEQFTQEIVKLIATISIHSPKKLIKDLTLIFDNISKNNTRIMYNIISTEIFKINEDDERDIVIANLSLISDAISNEELNPDGLNIDISNVSKLYIKLLDHCYLALSQRNHFNQSNMNYENLMNKYNKMDEKSKEIEKKIDKINFDTVSILGTFTGISFVLFGGITLVSKIGESNNFNMFFQFLLIGFIMINSIVVLMQYIKSISNNSIKVSSLIYNYTKNKPTWYTIANLLMIIFIVFLLLLEYSYKLNIPFYKLFKLFY